MIPAITDSYSRDHRLGGAKSAFKKNEYRIPHVTAIPLYRLSDDGTLVNVNLAFPQTFFFLSFFPSHSTAPSEASAWELACEQALRDKRRAQEKKKGAPRPYAVGQYPPPPPFPVFISTRALDDL